MSKSFIFLLMIFLHIFDDYKLQGILASMKQKKWWQENYPKKFYKYDYIVALITHAFSWSFMIMLPIVFYLKFNLSLLFIVVFFANLICHALIDDLKANKLVFNLIIDQFLHLVQIVTTALIFLWR